MKSPNYIHFFTKLSLFIIIAFAFFVFWNIDKVLSINNCNDGWQIAVGASRIINCHGVCKKITNSCSKVIFVPTRTSSEWAEFRDHKPGCVSLDDCNENGGNENGGNGNGGNGNGGEDPCAGVYCGPCNGCASIHNSSCCTYLGEECRYGWKVDIYDCRVDWCSSITGKCYVDYFECTCNTGKKC